MKKKIILIIILGLVGLFAVCGILLYSEQSEGRNLPVGQVDFSRMDDGAYTGNYEGGRFGWRANTVEVLVSGGKVTAIKLVENTEGRPAEFTDELFGKVVKAQSLQVDAISGATVSSNSYLKSIENAVSRAQ